MPNSCSILCCQRKSRKGNVPRLRLPKQKSSATKHGKRKDEASREAAMSNLQWKQWLKVIRKLLITLTEFHHWLRNAKDPCMCICHFHPSTRCKKKDDLMCLKIGSCPALNVCMQSNSMASAHENNRLSRLAMSECESHAFLNNQSTQACNGNASHENAHFTRCLQRALAKEEAEHNNELKLKEWEKTHCL